MTGQFIKKPTPSTILLLAGLGMICVAILTIVRVGFSPFPHTIFLVFGALVALFNLFVLIAMHTGVLHADDQNLHVRYLCFKTLDCPLSDVAFVLPQMNSLTVILKNGQCHTIAGLENSFAVGRYLRTQLFSLETNPVEELRVQLDALTAKRKNYIYFICGGFALWLATIFVTVALTDGRDIGDFTATDRIVFIISAIVQLLEVILLFWLANRCGLLLWPVEHTKFRLRSALISSQPLPAGNMRCVYTDPNFFQRVTLFEIPSEPDVYFVVERIIKDHQLIFYDSSSLISDEESILMEMDDTGIDITGHFI